MGTNDDDVRGMDRGGSSGVGARQKPRLRDQVKISGAFGTYVALATAVLHCLGWMTVAPERDEAGLGPVHVRKYRY